MSKKTQKRDTKKSSRQFSGKSCDQSYSESIESDSYYKFNAAKKQLVNMPDMVVENGENCYINEQNESTYDGANGKFVTVDQMRLKNINKMLNTLQQEFAMLNRDAEDGRNEYSVNNHYYTAHNQQILKTIDKLNEE